MAEIIFDGREPKEYMQETLERAYEVATHHDNVMLILNERELDYLISVVQREGSKVCG